jgi:hypothetical protein
MNIPKRDILKMINAIEGGRNPMSVVTMMYPQANSRLIDMAYLIEKFCKNKKRKKIKKRINLTVEKIKDNIINILNQINYIYDDIEYTYDCIEKFKEIAKNNKTIQFGDIFNGNKLIFESKDVKPDIYFQMIKTNGSIKIDILLDDVIKGGSNDGDKHNTVVLYGYISDTMIQKTIKCVSIGPVLSSVRQKIAAHVPMKMVSQVKNLVDDAQKAGYTFSMMIVGLALVLEPVKTLVAKYGLTVEGPDGDVYNADDNTRIVEGDNTRIKGVDNTRIEEGDNTQIEKVDNGQTKDPASIKGDNIQTEEGDNGKNEEAETVAVDNTQTEDPASIEGDISERRGKVAVEQLVKYVEDHNKGNISVSEMVLVDDVCDKIEKDALNFHNIKALTGSHADIIFTGVNWDGEMTSYETSLNMFTGVSENYENLTNLDGEYVTDLDYTGFGNQTGLSTSGLSGFPTSTGPTLTGGYKAYKSAKKDYINIVKIHNQDSTSFKLKHI